MAAQAARRGSAARRLNGSPNHFTRLGWIEEAGEALGAVAAAAPSPWHVLSRTRQVRQKRLLSRRARRTGAAL